MKSLAMGLLLLLSAGSLALASEPNQAKVEVIGKTHTIAAFNGFSGSGTESPGLATTYDMSIFEFNLGGKQSKFNGSGITTNANYPLTDGEALTNNTHIGLSSRFSEDLKAGFLIELYTLQGDKTVGRVFGEELPWDDFPRNSSGTIHPSRFQSNFYHAFLEGEKDQFQYKFVGGNLTPRELPEFTRKDMNHLKLGSLVYRAPITNESFFEKEDRKYEEGRHLLRGFDLIGNYEYMDKENIHFELFSGSTKPTPISDIERDAFSGRTSLDITDGNLGFTYVYSNGQRHTTNVEENQGVWAWDASYNLTERMVPYFAIAQTDYERENTGESHKGDAYVAGMLVKFPNKYEVKAQYQRLEENYDLMAYHKTEHYPANAHGVNAQLTIPVTETLKLKGNVYYLEQLETAVTSSDTLFGDNFFPANSGADKGTIDVQRISADWQALHCDGAGQAAPGLLLKSYVEHAKFYQDAPTPALSIDKDVYNFYVGGVWTVREKWSVEGGFRHFLSQGDWQSMPFNSYQNLPEAALIYKPNPETRGSLIYHYYNFEDGNVVAQGQNDYYGHQVIFEWKYLL